MVDVNTLTISGPTETTQAEGNAAPAPENNTPAAEAPKVEDTRPQILDEEVQRILDFDPFEPKPKPADTASAADTGKEPKVDGLPEGQKPAQEVAPKPDDQKTETVPSALDLQKLVTEQAAIIKSLTQKPAGDPAAPAPRKDEPAFKVNVPQELTTALGSEDPEERHHAVNALVQGMGTAILNQVATMVKGTVLDRIPHLIEEHQTSRAEQKKVSDDFFGTYKAFDTPVLRPIVHQVAMQLANEEVARTGTFAGWSPAFRDRVASTLQAHGIGVAPAAPPPPPPTPKPFQAQQTTRPAPTAGATEFSDILPGR